MTYIRSTLKLCLLWIFLLPIKPSIAQLQNGLSKNEVREMIAICNSFTFLDLYNSDDAIIPKGYSKEYTSGVFGMDNKYQIYRKGNLAVINLRGSTDKQISWIANIDAAMIPAMGKAEVDGEKINYCFALDKSAAVHSGFALAIFYLRKDLLYQITNLNKQGVFDFIITGHSQGGALANMLRAYLENLPVDVLSTKNRFKTYAFAAPMTGNKFFTAEYKSRFCMNGSSFNIVNLEDPIPNLPLSYNDSNSIKDNINTLLFDRENFSLKKLFTDKGLTFFDDKINSLAQFVSRSSNKKIAKELGPITIPEYIKDFNYARLECRIELAEFQYPRVLKDSSILRNDSLMALAIYQRDSAGIFYNQDVYKKGSWGFQHKPYNYYVAVLKKYFPEEYAQLKKKYLPENL